MTQILSVQNLNFSYEDQWVLRDLSYDFREGLFYSIVGPNGSGKTTFLKLLSGRLDTYKGHISLKGTTLNKYQPSQLAKNLAVVPQANHIAYEFLVEDIVMMGRAPYTSRFGSPSRHDRALVNSAMKETGVDRMRGKKITQLSGGELQRVILARAIAQETPLLLLDEPISHLDIGYQYEISDLVYDLCKRKGITIINIVHDLNIAMTYSDEILMMKNGQLFDAGVPEDVLTKENIKEVYGVDVDLLPHPHRQGKKVIIK